ncbi:uncharacterized protein LOC103097891 isoform X2 [Monodelphis domestica]|uniref:uncharacterized protein LOC103097891 isoform X2 n=1 Tax=Monodelphis domestica TaxID=13616 RepID=UPI0007B41772|nr:uncharacterized protein LOC103097891 isoform X2 [Monodelphis domestica]
MTQRRVQKIDLFSSKIEKDKEEKEPNVAITENAEGDAAHKYGWIETGREPSEVKTESIIVLEASEKRKKNFTDSVTFQEEVGDITVMKGEGKNYKTATISGLWITRELEFVVVELKKLIEEEDLKSTKKLQAIYDKTNNLKDKLTKCMNISEVNMEHQPDDKDKEIFSPGQIKQEPNQTDQKLSPEQIQQKPNEIKDQIVLEWGKLEDQPEKNEKGELLLGQFKIKPKEIKNEDISPGQLLAPGDFISDIRIEKKEQGEESLVEEEISSDRPTEEKAPRRFSWFRNIQGYNWRNFFYFKRHDEQIKNVYKQEKTDLKILDDASAPFGTPKPLVSEWTINQVGLWLASIGMKKYSLRFDYNRINGLELLELDNDELKYIGIEKREDRMKILYGIKKIQKTEKELIHFNNEIYRKKRQHLKEMAKREKCD